MDSSRQTQWHGQGDPDLSADEQSVAASVLWLLRGDAGQRALMAWSFGWEAARTASGFDWMTLYLGQLLEDPYDVVRYIAYRSLRSLPGYELLEFDYLSDPDSRSAVSRGVMDQWSREPHGVDGGPRPSVLIEESGRWTLIRSTACCRCEMTVRSY